jgi:hypothetical protein
LLAAARVHHSFILVCDDSPVAILDPDDRRLVQPNDPLTFRDWLWPQRHANYWLYKGPGPDGRGEWKTRDDLYEELLTEEKDVENPKAVLEQVQAVADTAAERAERSDRRATTVAGTVAIAASFTLTGGGLILDKVPEGAVRVTLAIFMFLTTVLFLASAVYALRALVKIRGWNWSQPDEFVVRDPNPNGRVGLATRGSYLYEDFANNWEIAEVKVRSVDRALVLLVVALISLVIVAAVLGAQAAFLSQK